MLKTHPNHPNPKQFLFLRKIFRPIKRILLGSKNLAFSNSAQYWNDRYNTGGTSGAGSYGRLAVFKAKFINDFVAKNSVSKVIEFGCGDGAQLALASYPQYVGFDVSPVAVSICKNKFGNTASYYEFYETTYQHPREGEFDLALSLDVIYHLIEDEVFDKYMSRLFRASSKYIIIYSYNFDKTYRSQHERGREFLRWCERNANDWSLSEVKKNDFPYDQDDPDNTSQSDFFVFKKHD